jgi:hypothetical protein
MARLSYRRHRFPPTIIQHAIWLYLRSTLSHRDVEDLLAERGLEISHETVRCWVLKFGPVIARKLRQGRPRPSERWHLDEMVVPEVEIPNLRPSTLTMRNKCPADTPSALASRGGTVSSATLDTSARALL